jgi:hypothetical protein
MTAVTKTEQITSDNLLIAGIQKHLASTTFIINSQSATAAQVIAVIQARVDKAQAIATAKAAWHTALVASQTEDSQTDTYVSSVRAQIQAMYASSPDILADFGAVPRKPRTPMTVAEKVLATAKRAATRKARGTLGKKQKEAVTGTLTGPIVVQTNGTTSTGGAPSASPAPSATPAASPAPAPVETPAAIPVASSGATASATSHP